VFPTEKSDEYCETLTFSGVDRPPNQPVKLSSPKLSYESPHNGVPGYSIQDECHIRSISISSPGPRSLRTHATLWLSNGVKTSFQVIEFDPPRHWKWAGSFLGAQILYDHIFVQEEPEVTKVRFTMDVSGGIGVLIRGVFSNVYRRNLLRAVLLLVAEIEFAARSRP
jgi:hypothetical protein